MYKKKNEILLGKGEYLMKKTLLAIILLSIVTILSSCGTPRGESIEDCRNMGGSCLYWDNDVKTEGSDLALSLQDLLINESDDIIFSYSIYPEFDKMVFTYYSSDEISVSSLDQLIPLTAHMIVVLNQYYEIDTIETRINYNQNITITVSHGQDLKITSLVADLNSNNADEDSVDQYLVYLEQRADKVRLLLDYGGFDLIYWCGKGSNVVFIKIIDENMNIATSGIGDDTAVHSKIQELLEGYYYTIL